MSGTRRLRASWNGSQKRRRDQRDLEQKQRKREREAEARGDRTGYRRRTEEYTFVCGTSGGRYVTLGTRPKHDMMLVPLSEFALPLSYEEYAKNRYFAVCRPRAASFIPERQCWTDGAGLMVQWWTWKFAGLK